MNQFSKQELKRYLDEAHNDLLLAMDYTNIVDLGEDGKPVPAFEYVNHMAQLSIASSMLVIAGNLTAMRYGTIDDRLGEIGEELFHLRELLDTRLP